MIMTWDFYIIPKNIFNKLIWFSCDSLSKCYFKKGIHYWQGTFYRPERIQTNLVRCHGFVVNKKVRVRLLLPCRTLTSFAYKLTLLFWHFFQDIEKPIFINGPTCPWYNPVLFFFFFQLLLEYSWFTMLYSFLLYCEMNHMHTYTSTPF